MAGERQGRQASARPSEDRQAGRSVAVQGRRASDAAPQLRAAGATPRAAGSDPLPRRPDRRAHGEKQRAAQRVEDAQIKLRVVASDIFGVAGRAMLAALVAGERDPKVLADLARTRLRAKTAALQEAFVGRFTAHHAFLVTTMLQRIDQASTAIATVEARIEAKIAPFAAAVDRLDEIHS